MRIEISLIAFVALLSTFAAGEAQGLRSGDGPTLVVDRYIKGDFSLVWKSQAADILVSSDDFKVVQIAAQNFAEDVERVTGKKPALSRDASHVSRYAVIVGTLGKSPFINSLVRIGKLNVEQMRGQWESFVIATVPRPMPNVEMGLVIVGSDRRGTAFGVFELSQAIGVSPWYWWADVPPTHHENLFVAGGMRREGPPSVQYRRRRSIHSSATSVQRPTRAFSNCCCD